MTTTTEQQETTISPPPPHRFEIVVARKIESLSSSLLQTFLQFDVDRDGYVTRSDLKTAFHNILGIDLTRDQMDAIFVRFAYFEESSDKRRELEQEDAAAAKDETEKQQQASSSKTKTHPSHGIRYKEFVKYIESTATEMLPSSSTATTAGGSPADDIAPSSSTDAARMMSITKSPDVVTADLRKELKRLIRSHTSSGGMEKTFVFLQADTHRSGRVTLDEFRDGAANLGLSLTTAQVEAILGKDHYNRMVQEEGIDFKEFAQVIEGLDETGADKDQVEQQSTADGHADERAREHLHQAVHKCVDDSRTDRDIIRTIAERLYNRKKKLLDAFRKFDVDGSGRIDAKELRDALQEAGLDVSEERAKSLVDKFDRDGDGKLNKGEFVRLIASGSSEEEAAMPASTTPSDTEEMRRSIVGSVLGHEDEHEHRDIANRLDDDDIVAVMNFREALEAERIIMRNAFQIMDKDGSKSLSAEELSAGFEKMGLDVSQDHIDHIMKRFDSEGTGRLKYYQFVKLVSTNLND